MGPKFLRSYPKRKKSERPKERKNAFKGSHLQIKEAMNESRKALDGNIEKECSSRFRTSFDRYSFPFITLNERLIPFKLFYHFPAFFFRKQTICKVFQYKSTCAKEKNGIQKEAYVREMLMPSIALQNSFLCRGGSDSNKYGSFF